MSKFFTRFDEKSNILRLDCNYFNKDDVSEVCDFLKNNEIHHLCLNHISIKNDDLQFLLNTLKICESIKILEIMGLKLYHEEINLLCEILSNRALTKLTLAFLDVNLSDILKNVQKNHLTELNLLKIDINDSIYNFLKNNNNLTKLSLCFNQINEHFIKELCRLLEKNYSLKTLNLSYSLLNKRSGKYLSKLLETNQTLTSLNLTGNPIRTYLRKHMHESLEKNYSLTELIFEDYKIPFRTKSLLQRNISYKKKRTVLLLLVREFTDQSPFHKNNFPLDLFKIIYFLIREN